jgi:apolipoprotein N-acyltransferase
MRVLSLTVLALIGVGVSFAFLSAMALIFLMPAIAFAQPSRRMAFLAAFTYYAASSWAIIPAIRNFFGPDAGPVSGVLLWLAASTLLALPGPVVWSSNRQQAFWRIPVGIALGVFPPLGIIGWASPLLSAGLLFPGTAWLGLAAVLILPAWLVTNLRVVASAGALCAVCANLAFPRPPEPPAGWEAIDTHLHSETALEDFQSAQWLQQRALASHATVIVFPESVVPIWTEATEAFWQPTLTALRASGKTVVLGACIPAFGRPGYQNSALVVGAGSGGTWQRIPVPLGMWKPLSNEGVALRPFSSGVTTIHSRRVAILICYEQLLPLPILESFSSRPDLLLGMSNDHRTRCAAIRHCQHAALEAWSRLFNLPTLLAVNQ